MTVRIRKEFVDPWFGFPVRLIDVPMRKTRGVWIPKINYNRLSLAVLRALSRRPARLTGNQVRFIRLHFEMTLQGFARRFSVTHPAVLKWEKAKDAVTGMNWATEKDIRLFIVSKLDANPDELAGLYFELEAVPHRKPAPIRLDAKTLAA